MRETRLISLFSVIEILQKQRIQQQAFANRSNYSRVNILAIPTPPPPPGGGRNKQISENEEEIKVFYCLAPKNEEEIRKRWGKISAKIFTPGIK